MSRVPLCEFKCAPLLEETVHHVNRLPGQKYLVVFFAAVRVLFLVVTTLGTNKTAILPLLASSTHLMPVSFTFGVSVIFVLSNIVMC